MGRSLLFEKELINPRSAVKERMENVTKCNLFSMKKGALSPFFRIRKNNAPYFPGQPGPMACRR